MEKMKIKKLFALILCAVLALSSLPCVTVGAAEPKIYYIGPSVSRAYKLPENKTGFFEFESERKNYTNKYGFYYNDEFFSDSAYGYNHDLSRMSLRLAMAAFAVKWENSAGEKDYSSQYIYVYSLLRQLGFAGYGYNEFYAKQPETDSIAVSAASKRIRYPDGNYTLIAVGVRGGEYENEWGGNFRIGTGQIHEGFNNASRQVISFIQKYVKDKRIDGDIKLWITGFSRAAATTNVTASLLDENPDIFGEDVSLRPENIYAYCFETPAGVRFEGNDSLYNNIFSIVNYYDPVPKVVMEDWGYWRRGVTLFLPSKLWTNPDKYKRLYTAMRSFYDQYCAEEFRKDKYNVDNYEKQGITLDKIMGKMAKAVETPSNYEKNYQELFVEIGEKLIGEERAADFLNALNEAMSRRGGMLYVIGGAILGRFWRSSTSGDYRKLRASLTEALWAADVQQPVTDESLKLFTDLFFDIGVTELTQVYSNIDKLGAAHYPELCLAWLDAITENDLYDGSTRRVYMNSAGARARTLGPDSAPAAGADDIEVFDSEGALVAAVYDGQVREIENGLVAYIDENGQTVVYLPVDGDYTTRITSESDGQINYSVQEQNPSEETEIVSYTADVNPGNTLTGKATVMTDGDGEYTFRDDDGDPVTIEILDEGEAFDVEADVEGAGTVAGGGSLHTGEWAGLAAVPLEGESFSGWYEDGRLVSSDPVLRFAVTGDRTLTAKFSDELCDVLFVSGDDVLASQRVEKGKGADLGAVNPSAGHVIDGFYLDGAMTLPVDSATVFDGDAEVYVKQSVRTEPGIAYVNAVNSGGVLSVGFMTEMVPDGAKAYAAAYTADGRMTAAVEASLSDGAYAASLPAENAYAVRVYVWDGDKKMSPLCKSAETRVIEV